MTNSALLDVSDLRVSFQTPDGVLDAVRGISFSVDRGKVLGIVGESGSGKSVATQTMVGLTQGARVSGKALFDGRHSTRTSGITTRPPARASAAADASNIGFVIYTKSYAPGTLNARWIYSGKYSGSGIAVGGPREGFVGRYHVRYYYDVGRFSDEYDLVIEKAGDVYNASWITSGQVAAVGVGMEVQNGLAVGCRRVAD